MSTNKKRSYDSGSRQAQALETRKRILRAASDLFRHRGFEGVQIDAIAKKAGVASPTVYAQFKSKRGVLLALLDESLPAEQFESLVQQSKVAKTAKEKLKVSAKIARSIYDAERSQMEFYQGAQVISPELKELEQERERRRYERQEETIHDIAKLGELAKGVDVTKARDIMWAFTGRDLYRMMVVEQRWTSDEYEEWLVRLLSNSLLGN